MLDKEDGKPEAMPPVQTPQPQQQEGASDDFPRIDTRTRIEKGERHEKPGTHESLSDE